MKLLFSEGCPKGCLLFLLIGLVLSGCIQQDASLNTLPDTTYITKLKLTLVNTQNAADSVTALIIRRDPDDKIAPDTGKNLLILRRNVSYFGKLVLLDTTTTPITDVSSLILLQRSTKHLVFYQPLPLNTDTSRLKIPGSALSKDSSFINIRVSATDRDNGVPALPVGFSTLFTVSSADLTHKSDSVNTGHLRVLMRHQPDYKDGRFSPVRGSTNTDFDYYFRILIKN